MSMTTWNVVQFICLLVGYVGFTVGLPAFVFYGKMRRFPPSVRFLTYFTIGNFYIINLVQVLQLLRISSRITLMYGTFLPALLAMVWLYRLPMLEFFRNILMDSAHYVLREMGLKSFLIRRWKELRVFLWMVGRNLRRLFRENYMDIPFLLLFGWLMWRICGPGILENWAYGASDVPVHNYWINGLMDNNIFIAGIYPMGMHCMIYYLSLILNITVFDSLRLFWLVEYAMIAVTMLAFLKGACRNRFLPYVGTLMFIGINFFNRLTYFRYGATLPQEYGMLYILPSVFFAMEFFRARRWELNRGINRIRCTSTWCLLGFAMNFSLTLSSHFYDTMIAGVICVGIVLGYGYWFWRREYFFRVMLGGILGVLLAFFPMAAAFLTGKKLQGSMYWAMSIIGLRDYTVLIFGIICVAVLAIPLVGGLLFAWGWKKGKISFENQKIPTHSLIGKIVLQLLGLVPLAGAVCLGWILRDKILSVCGQYVFTMRDLDWVLVCVAGVLAAGLLLRYLGEGMNGAGILSILAAEILLGVVVASERLGLPTLMEPDRSCIYFAFLFPVVLAMGLDGGVRCLISSKYPGVQEILSLLLTMALLVLGAGNEWIRVPFGGGKLEMNEAILCTTNILYDNQGQNHRWTIVSANDEYRMVEKYGRHTETIEFLEGMEHWNRNKEVLIPTERVYFYIEKKPLNYANGYPGTVPEVSEEQADQSLPENVSLSAYNGTRRAVTMSRMYYWAQRFRELYPNEMKVYFENENFVCYYIEQNVYSLYNFAINYGYNVR